MSDDEKPVSATAETIAPTPVSTTPAPAVHDGVMWGGPMWIHNITPTPVFVRTKAEYWALLNKHDKHMKDQQESTTGPELVPAVTPVPVELQPAPPPAPLTMAEARIIASMSVVFRRYGLVESLYCQTCFAHKRPEGCRQTIKDREVSIECRCGTAAYHPPLGTTDLVVREMANSPVKELDRTKATIMSGEFGHALPAVILNSTEAMIIRAYGKFLRDRHYEPRWFCRGCWDGSLGEDASVGINISADRIVLLCKCRVIFEQNRALPAMPTTIH